MARYCAQAAPHAMERVSAPCGHNTPRLAPALRAAFGHHSRQTSIYHSVVEAPSHRQRTARMQAAEATAPAEVAAAAPGVAEALPLPAAPPTQLVYSAVVFDVSRVMYLQVSPGGG